MKDFLNQEIKVGDSIVYPNRLRSDLWMNLAKVTHVNAESVKTFKRKDGNVEVITGSIQVRREDGTTKTITRVNRVVVVSKQIER